MLGPVSDRGSLVGMEEILLYSIPGPGNLKKILPRNSKVHQREF